MKSCNLMSFLVTMTMTIILSLLKLDTGSSKLVVEGSQQRQSQDLGEGGVPTRRQRGLSKTWSRSALNAKTWRDGQIDGEGQEDRDGDGDGRNRKGRELKSEECSNGVTGVQSSGGSFCCPEECGECGGSGCSQMTLGANLCCTSAIESSGVLCEDSGEAPCIIIDSTSKLVEMMRPKQELNQDLILPQAETAVMNLAGDIPVL